MRLLLDTHVFLWAVTANRRLKAATREFLSQADAIYVSAASIWEIAIKMRLGKIEADAASLANAINDTGVHAAAVNAHFPASRRRDAWLGGALTAKTHSRSWAVTTSPRTGCFLPH